MKLLSMTDFVISQIKTDSTVNDSLKKDLADVRNYALFLTQPLTLGMFVPCDENGNVLNEPRNDFRGYEDYSKRLESYQEAKERVLFKGFEGRGGLSVAIAICQTYENIDDLTHKNIILENLELTESAKKQIL